MPEQVKFALFNVTPTNYQDHYRLLYDKITAIQKRHPAPTEDHLWCHEECDSNVTRFESFMNARAICLQTNVTGRDLRMLMCYFQGIFDENQYISLTSDDDDDDDDDVGDNVVVAREQVGVIFTVNDLIEYLRYGLVYGRFRPLRRRRSASSDDSRSEGDLRLNDAPDVTHYQCRICNLSESRVYHGICDYCEKVREPPDEFGSHRCRVCSLPFSRYYHGVCDDCKKLCADPTNK